jgi:hypothetical protein
MLGGRYATWLCKNIPWEGGWDAGVGMFSSIKPNNRILIENLQKNEFSEFISMEKYTQILFIKHIWQKKDSTILPTAKFVKSFLNHKTSYLYITHLGALADFIKKSKM